jgi:cell division septum initiation protein DivIVA
MQRELVTLRRDKSDLADTIENLKQKLSESQERENQSRPRIVELSRQLNSAELKIETQVCLLLFPLSFLLTAVAIYDLEI